MIFGKFGDEVGSANLKKVVKMWKVFNHDDDNNNDEHRIKIHMSALAFSSGELNSLPRHQSIKKVF